MNEVSKPDIRITLIQKSLAWEDVPANLHAFENIINGLSGDSDLVVLPEMFNTGFSMNPSKLREEMNGPTIQWMANMASAKQAVVCGSLIIEEGQKYYNRLIWMRPNGSFDIYDKRHLFAKGGEDKEFTRGTEKLLVDLNGWVFCPQVCYDLRFPVWNRNTDNYDVYLTVANWPEIRSEAWTILLRARAIENQAYAIGLNRVGTDGNGIYHSGNSIVADPMGKVIFETTHDERVETIILSYNAITEVRKHLPYLKDADKLEILD